MTVPFTKVAEGRPFVARLLRPEGQPAPFVPATAQTPCGHILPVPGHSLRAIPDAHAYVWFDGAEWGTEATRELAWFAAMRMWLPIIVRRHTAGLSDSAVEDTMDEVRERLALHLAKPLPEEDADSNICSYLSRFIAWRVQDVKRWYAINKDKVLPTVSLEELTEHKPLDGSFENKLYEGRLMADTSSPTAPVDPVALLLDALPDILDVRQIAEALIEGARPATIARHMGLNRSTITRRIEKHILPVLERLAPGALQRAQKA